MELRSTKQRNYKQLKLTLKGYGVFEDGMEVEEMEQILMAMELSASQLEANRSQQDLQQALWESEIGFAPLPEGFLNSTMIGAQQAMDTIQTETASAPPPAPPKEPTSYVTLSHANSSGSAHDCNSPLSEPITIVVHADVHHPQNWSPTNRERLPCKRLASEASSIHDSIESDSKRSHISDETPNSGVLGAESSDSGVNWDERGSSLFDESSPVSIGEVENQLLVSTSSAAVSENSHNTQGDVPEENLSGINCICDGVKSENGDSSHPSF